MCKVQICLLCRFVSIMSRYRELMNTGTGTIVQPLKSGFSGYNSKHKWRDHLGNMIGYYM